MKVRLHGSFVDWVDLQSVTSGLPFDEAELLAALLVQRRRRDGSLTVELVDDDVLIVKRWAAWAIHVLTPKKANPGPARGIWNSATALVRQIDRAREVAR